MNDMLHGGEWKDNKIQLDYSVNLNPLGMPAEVKRLIADDRFASLTERYPDRECEELRQLLGKRYGVDKESVICGNGASELIMNTIKALALLGIRKVMLPVPSFIGYERSLEAPFCQTSIKTVYYTLERKDCFAFTDAFIRELESFTGSDSAEGDKALILCNPNNPTGQLMDKDLSDKVIKICSESGIRLVVDECFLGFCNDESKRTLKHLTKSIPNICVIDAFTKLYSIPGIRLGFMISGDGKLVDTVKKLLPEWNVSMPAQEVGKEILHKVSAGYIEETKMLVNREREYLCDELTKAGFTVYPGDACFILFRTPENDKYHNLQTVLAGRGILIRNCGNFKGLDRYDHRIAVRDRCDNEILIKTINECLV
ncbi:MAG: aminotransferase class I/II-fold pyridoxal phosphate-dependent enzyme [Lachnospiraceae bacterium]|nr:aminotransferase class I/II-fold pyridoxal phosphate-dependent enzyme [Lachnospiraceae bacterium]